LKNSAQGSQIVIRLNLAFPVLNMICFFGLHVYWISSVFEVFWLEFAVSRLEHSKIKTLICDRVTVRVIIDIDKLFLRMLPTL